MRLFIIIFIVIAFTSPFLMAEEDNSKLIKKINDIQHYLLLSDERNNHSNLPDQTIEFKDGVLQITSAENDKIIKFKSSNSKEFSITIPSQILNASTYFDTNNNRIIFQDYDDGEKTKIIDLVNNSIISCPVSITYNRLTQIGEMYFFIKNGDYNTVQLKGTITQLAINENKCDLKSISEISYTNESNLSLYNADGNIGLIGERSEWGTLAKSGYAFIENYDQSGKKMSSNEFKNLIPAEKEYTFFDSPDPALSSKAKVFILIDKNDPEQRLNAYLLKDNNHFELIAKNVISAKWIDNDNLLLTKGSHATSSELYVLNMDKNMNPKKIEAPDGVKSNVKIERGKITFQNITPDKSKRLYNVDLIKNMSIEIDSDANNLLPNLAELPTTKEISYPSGDHKVPSFLSIPKAGCKAGEKKPIIVYLHGGSYNSHLSIKDEKDHLLFAQLGWPVITAGYYGDTHAGEEFKNGLDRYIDRDRYTKTLEDIQSAGEYAKTLPCADPNKIILTGHSHGRIIASLYATDKKFKEISPFTGFVLRNGLARDEDIMNFVGGNKPEVASLKTPANISVSLSIKQESNLLICHPDVDVIGIENAMKLIKEINKFDDKFFGIVYKYSNETLNEILPMRRVQNVTNRPILIVSTSDGSGDGVNPGSEVIGSKMFEEELKKYSSKIEGWYPNELFQGKYPKNGHVLEGDIEVEFILKMRSWVEALSPSQ